MIIYDKLFQHLHASNCPCVACELERRSEEAGIKRLAAKGELPEGTIEASMPDKENRACIDCGDYSKGQCDGCKEPLCYGCNQELNGIYGWSGDGKCFQCRDKD